MERGDSWPICKAKPLKGKESGDKELGELKDVKITQHVGRAEEEMKTRLGSVFYDQKNLTPLVFFLELLWLRWEGACGVCSHQPRCLGLSAGSPETPQEGDEHLHGLPFLEGRRLSFHTWLVSVHIVITYSTRHIGPTGPKLKDGHDVTR